MGPDGTTSYYHDGIRPIWETNASGQLTSQYDRDIFGNLLSRRDNASVRWYYHHDGLGSTSALTNSTGSVVAAMLHDAWGNIRTNSGSAHGNYRFTGAERDTTTGLYHMGARFYDPVIGRWLSEDPVQDQHFEPASLNFYAYVANNPLIFVDPKGTYTEDARRAWIELVRLAHGMNVSPDALVAWAADFVTAIGTSSTQTLNQLLTVASAVNALTTAVSVLAIAQVAGLAISPKTTGAISRIGLVAAGVGGITSSALYLGGQMTLGNYISNLLGFTAGYIPGMGLSLVIKVAQSAQFTFTQGVGVAIWGMHRAYGVISFFLKW